MPSWELLDAQPADCHVAVLPTGFSRLIIEARTTLAGVRYVGDRGNIMGLDRLALQRLQVLFEQFGFTVENMVQQARTLVLE